jgi:ribosomal protein S18 acetylase RimI-like enzyme
MTVEFRRAESEDRTLLERDVKTAVGRSLELELREQSEGVHSIYIAIDSNIVIGWGFLRWLGPRDPIARGLFPDAPEVFRLEVHEAYRSTGIGRNLIAEMESAAVSAGFSEISLGVAHDNPRAYSLYRQIGFTDTELNEYFDEYQYPLKGGGIGVARDLCRYMVKRL